MIALGGQSKSRATVRLAVLAGLWSLLVAGATRGGDDELGDASPGHRWLFHKASPPRATGPLTATEIAQRIDRAAESIRDDGLVVLKQPDVFSQARMTKYRREFEEIMSQEKDKFRVLLAGRVARVDQASLDSQSSLSASLAPQGTSVNVAAPTTANPPVAPALNGQFDAPRFVAPPTLGQDTLQLGLEPNSVLDEQKSYLDRLSEIRRVNLGNDIADSAGYGLYLVRMPVSITPGECTLHGHGAEMAVTIKHEFPANFLPNTFRNLVVNDLVDQLGPPIYEVVRAKVDRQRRIETLKREADKLKVDAENQLAKVVLQAANGVLVPGIKEEVKLRGSRIVRPHFLDKAPAVAPLLVSLPPGGVEIAPLPPINPAPKPDRSFADFGDHLFDYIFRQKLTADIDQAPTPAEADQVIVQRVEVLLGGARKVLERWRTRPGLTEEQARQYRENLASLDEFAEDVKQIKAGRERAGGVSGFNAGDLLAGETLLRIVLQDYFFVEPKQDNAKLADYLSRLYSSALPDDVANIDNAFQIDSTVRLTSTSKLAATNLKYLQAQTRVGSLRDLIKSLRLPADRAAKRSYPIAPGELLDFFLETNIQLIADDVEASRPTETVRASDVRSYLRQQLSVAYDLLGRPSSKVEPPLAPLDDQILMDQILEAIHRRSFGPVADGSPPLFEIAQTMIAHLSDHLAGRSLGALAWAIAVDAALLDEALRQQAAITFQTNSLPCPDWATIRFYHVQPDLRGQASTVFNDYVANRWPMITFALDPVVDQQNILDSFSLRRDLQLALAFAFSTGKINFSQLTTFRRKIQQDEETVALNKTVTSFAHGNETFGWRLTPRLQTPPTQGNLATLGSTLLRGGPGPNYGLRKSKLEAGQRELVAVVIMPSFLPTIRVESSGNWFRLDDPEHLEVRTRRMLEQGRRIHELRQQVLSACDSTRYRPADIRYLRTKIDQIDAMLPIQSRVVALPFDNAAAGFDLFTEGTTALVPELSGFEGAEAVLEGRETDLLIFGKYLSIHETRVVAGGRSVSARNGDGYEILSREVMSVHLPRDVQASRTRDGQSFVEIYLATPNGISNRLLVPYLRQGEALPGNPPAAAAATDPDGTVITTYETTRKQFPARVVSPAPAAPTVPPATEAKLIRRGADDPAPAPREADARAAEPRTSQVRSRSSLQVAFREAGRQGVAPLRTLVPEPGSLNDAAEGFPSLPELAGLTPPRLADPGLLRTSLIQTLPGAVVLPTPIIVMPPAPAARPRRHSLLARVFDRFHHGRGDASGTPRP